MTVDLTPVAQACAAGSRIGLLNANPRFLSQLSVARVEWTAYHRSGGPCLYMFRKPKR